MNDISFVWIEKIRYFKDHFSRVEINEMHVPVIFISSTLRTTCHWSPNPLWVNPVLPHTLVTHVLCYLGISSMVPIFHLKWFRPSCVPWVLCSPALKFPYIYVPHTGCGICILHDSHITEGMGLSAISFDGCLVTPIRRNELDHNGYDNGCAVRITQ